MLHGERCAFRIADGQADQCLFQRAGHAGGIMSSALDGANSALALARTGVGAC